jgi:hypothetical protein
VVDSIVVWQPMSVPAGTGLTGGGIAADVMPAAPVAPGTVVP